MVYCYSDGGLAGDNPSYTGGAWGFRVVQHVEPPGRRCGSGGVLGPRDHEADAVVLERVGVLLPSFLDCPAVTNNHVELWGLCEAVLAVAALNPPPDGVTFCPDSRYALNAVVNTRRANTAPVPLVRRFRESLTALDCLPFPSHFEHIAGHPETGYVRDGIKFKGENGERFYRVSRHNAEIDAACTAACADLPPPDWEEIKARQGTGLFTVGEILALKGG